MMAVSSSLSPSSLMWIVRYWYSTNKAATSRRTQNFKRNPILFMLYLTSCQYVMLYCVEWQEGNELDRCEV
jgi:hypothetical protein